MSTSESPNPCTIVRAAEGNIEPCAEDDCVYWERGCVLDRVDSELVLHPEVAALLLNMRRALEAEREQSDRDERAAAAGVFHRRLAAGRE